MIMLSSSRWARYLRVSSLVSPKLSVLRLLVQNVTRLTCRDGTRCIRKGMSRWRPTLGSLGPSSGISGPLMYSSFSCSDASSSAPWVEACHMEVTLMTTVHDWWTTQQCNELVPWQSWLMGLSTCTIHWLQQICADTWPCLCSNSRLDLSMMDCRHGCRYTGLCLASVKVMWCTP